MNFKDFKKELKKVDYKSKKDWEIFLPFDVTREKIQSVIDLSREHMLVDWHVIFPEITEKVPEPDIKIYWDRKQKEKNDERI